MRWTISGFGALVGVLALMGCGSAEKKDYLREANAICASAQKRLDKIPAPSSPAQVPSVTKRELAVRKDAIAQLGELAAPLEIAGGADDVFQDLETRQERARAMMKATEDKDEKKLREIKEEARTESALEAGRATAAGLRDCAEL